MMKMVKEKNKYLKYFNDTFQLSTGIERFVLSILSLLLFCHLTSCFWFMVADLGSNESSWLIRYEFDS